MKTSTARRLLALGIGAVLVLSGCSDASKKDDAADKPVAQAPADETMSLQDLAAVKSVELKGERGKKPELSFEAPFSVSGVATVVASPGDGDEIKAGDTISFHSVAYSGKTGTEKDGEETYSQEPVTASLDPNNMPQVLIDALVGEKVGVRLVFARPDAEGEVVVLSVEVVGTKPTPKPLDRATGTAVKPQAGLPEVTLDEAGVPTVKLPEGYSEPDGLIVETLIEGEGEAVEATQRVAVHYIGYKLDGTSFESSWASEAPAAFMLNEVIPGWTEGLTGKKVGSQVLLVIPPELAYGDQGELAGETLIFVVDILAAI